MVRPSYYEEQPRLWIEEAPPVEEARPEKEPEQQRGVEVVFPPEDDITVIPMGGDDGDD